MVVVEHDGISFSTIIPYMAIVGNETISFSAIYTIDVTFLACACCVTGSAIEINPIAISSRALLSYI